MMRIAIAVAMLLVSGSVVASSTDSQVSPHGNAKTMTKQIVHTDKAPAAIGPYSQAVKAGNTVYFSGQIPLDPATGAIVEGGIEAQARRAFDNLKAVAEAAGGSLDKVVRTMRDTGRDMAEKYKETARGGLAVNVVEC